MKKIINEEFWLSSWDTVVVKVGSNILAGNTNWVNLDNIENIVKWIEYLMKIGLNVFLVSSGAIAIWKNIISSESEKNENDYKNAFYSTIWQGKLIELYYKLFDERNIKISQNLLTHNDFKDEEKINHLKEVWKYNTKTWVLAIINENDALSKEELWFSDNDELAWLVAKSINAKVLILLSNINWIYKNYNQKDEELIEEVKEISKVLEFCEDWKSMYWRGWMQSKLNVMQEMMNNWITWILANWAEKDIIEKIFKWEESRKTIFRV